MSTHDPETWNLRRSVAATLLIAGLVLVALGVVWLRNVLLMLFAGMVVATALRPACEFIAHRTKLSLAHAAALVYLSLTVITLGLALWFSPTLLKQGESIVGQLPQWYASGRTSIASSSSNLVRLASNWLPANLPNLPMSGEGGGAMEMSQRALMALAAVAVIGVLAFYWTISEEQTIRALLRFAPEHRRGFYLDLIGVLLAKLGAYIRGQMLLCTIVFALSLVAYLVLGLPYALVLALVAGLLEAIPVIGPTLGAVPAVVVALSMNPQLAVWVIAAAVVIQLLENYLLVPVIMDHSVGIGAIVTLLAIVAFGALFGFLGAVLAIPLAAIVQTLFERLVLQRDFKDQEFTAPRDSTGVAHYQLQDLIHDIRRQQRSKAATINEFTTASFDEIERLAVALDSLIVGEQAFDDEEDEDEYALTPARNA